MRLLQLAPLALIVTVLGGCTCADTVGQTRFACRDTSECLPGFTCRGGECRSDDTPPGPCAEGDHETCAVASCERVCGADGGWSACAPSTGPGFERDPNNCGACGRQCSARLGDSLTCIAGRCTCTSDLDCPSGDVCLAGGVCGMDTDPCAHVSCALGEVCRGGTCAPVTCAAGCDPGEVCDTSSGNCRAILPCHFATPCADGGICEDGAQPDGEPCNDGEACTSGDTCRAGTCSGTSYSCPAPGACQQAVACAGDGGCEITPATDGTPCDDGVSCTHTDQCVAGACAGTTYTCSPNQCAATSVCAGDGGCDVTPRNVGAACDDGQPCSFNDACGDAGTCSGTTYACPGVTQCKEAGLCLGDGGCDVVNKANGTPCDDGLGCTDTDVCTAGSCGGTAVTSYLDSDGDGRGTSAMTQTTCPLAASYVLDAGDCNDNSAFVYNLMPAAVDVDQDGFTATATLNAAACVGAASTVNGRTYYRSTSGAYSWLATASATADCNDADPDVFESRPSVVTDVDHDGYSVGAAAGGCVGAPSVINGRTYYANAAGAFVYLDSGASLGSDCLDFNANVFLSRSVARDTDQDGFTTTTVTATQCTGASSVVNTRTYFADTAGNFSWLGSASAAADCDDTNAAITGTTLYYPDADGDTFGSSTASGTARCGAVAGEVANNTDCDDTNVFIYTTRAVALDADQDSFTTTTVLASQCVGASGTGSGGRTYYRDASNALTWLGTASTTADCNDASAAVFPQTYYADTDGDGFGVSTTSQVQCPRQTGWVANSTDCDDTNGTIYRSIALLYDDADHDGYTNSAAATLCVGSSTTINGRTYYRNASGSPIYTTTNLGPDCNTGSGALFTSRNNMVRDDDRDGYPASVTDLTQCAGATSTVGTRTYYSDGTGGYWMVRGDCIQRNGANCDPAFVDCYDQNAAANFTQTAYFTTHRGDGSFDYDCSGAATPSTAGTYCASTTSGVALFTDGTCGTSAGTGTTCTSPTAFVLPAACGKVLAGAGTFTNGGVCTADTLASATTIGCR